MMRTALLRACLLALVPASAAAQNDWYVDPTAAPPGNGSFVTPFASIQFAIFQTSVLDGDRLLLAPGTYDVPIALTNKRLEIIGLEGPEATIIDVGGVGSAVSIVGEQAEGSRLEGLTLTGGGGTDGAWGTFPTLPGGGGLYVEDSDVTVLNCVFRDNEFLGVGGAIFSRDATLLVKDSVLRDNGVFFWSQIQDGGAVFSQNSTVVLSGCLLENNNTYFGAGAVRQRGGALRMEECTVRDNAAGFDDGGAVLVWETLTVIEDCLFEGNQALDIGSGGAIAALAADVTVDRCTFRANEGDDGGAVFGSGAILEIRDSSFDGNRSWEYDPIGFAGRGGAIAMNSFSPGFVTISRSTFTFNTAEGSASTPGLGMGGAIHGDATIDRCSFYGNLAYDTDGAVCGGSVHNSVLWMNLPNEAGGGAVLEYCDVEGGYPGPGNFDADPLFWLPDEGDLHLRAGSPCLDAGDPNMPLDRDGTIADVGAFPVDPAYVPPTVSYCATKLTASGCVPAAGAEGIASVSTSTLTATCTGLDPDRFGLMVWALSPFDAPLFGGRLCVGMPFVRSGVLHSGFDATPCSGVFTFDFSPAYLAQQGLVAGDVVYAQFYYRDPSSPEMAGTSDGVRFTVRP